LNYITAPNIQDLEDNLINFINEKYEIYAYIDQIEKSYTTINFLKFLEKNLKLMIENEK
jgi:hypothetical protein